MRCFFVDYYTKNTNYVRSIQFSIFMPLMRVLDIINRMKQYYQLYYSICSAVFYNSFYIIHIRRIFPSAKQIK